VKSEISFDTGIRSCYSMHRQLPPFTGR